MENTDTQIDIMVYALLQTGERVIEVTRDHIMIGIWDREDSPMKLDVDKYLGKKIADIASNDNIFAQCNSRVEQCFVSTLGTDATKNS